MRQAGGSVPESLPERPAPVLRRTVYVISFPTGNYDPAHVLEMSRLLAPELSEATVFHGYKDPDATPYVGFDIYQDRAFLEPQLPPRVGDVYDLGDVFRRHDLCRLVREGRVDEVWIWEGGFGGLWEWVENGPDWNSDGGTRLPNCGRQVAVMALHNGRELDVALHSFAHRMEGTMRRYRPCDFSTRTWPWPAVPAGCLDGTASDQTGFVARPFDGNGFVAACGDVHNPPNLGPEDPGDFSNPNTVQSICEDWRRDGRAVVRPTSCENWGCSQLGYMRWWLQNVPGLDNTSTDRLGEPMDNWWVYYFLGPPGYAPTTTPRPTRPTSTASATPTRIPTRTPPWFVATTATTTATPQGRPAYCAYLPAGWNRIQREDLARPVFDPMPTATPTSTATATPPLPPVYAYHVPPGTVGNQAHTGALGLDFDVAQPVRVTALGAFDSAQDGLWRPIDVYLVDRSTRGALAHLVLTGEEAPLVDGSRYLPLAEPIELPAGFRGSIVAEGYGPDEPNGNSEGRPPPWTTDDGDGALRFVGGGRYADGPLGGGLPPKVDSGPANRYAAGTLAYLPDGG